MSIYKGLFISDIHMNNNLPHARPTMYGRTDRMEDQIELWRRVGKTALEHEVEDIWILGDLTDHGRLDAITLAETAKALAELRMDTGCKIRLLPGNHDANSTQGERFNMEAFGHLAGVLYIGGCIRPQVVKPWLMFWPLEYAPVEKNREQLAEIREGIADCNPFGKNVLLMHNSVIGCTHAGWACDNGLTPEEVTEGFDYTLSGHFHDPQKFGGEKGMYLGAPMHHRFDDAERAAGYWVITFHESPSRAPDALMIDGGAPKFHEFDFGDPKLKKKLRRVVRGDYLRLKVVATHAGWIKLAPRVFEVRDALVAEGIRATFVHKPVYHHAVRVAGTERASGDVVSMDSNVASYVDSDIVDTTGLNLKRLREIGRKALDAARTARATK